MISYLKGELVEVLADKAVVEVGGIGYNVFMPERSLSNLPPSGSEVKLYTYLNVKEDAMQLFGFLTQDDLNVYKLVIGVSGIGPKGGLNILSVLSTDEIRFAVIGGDAKAISKAPGIGKKTAEKMIIELKDKLNLEDTLTHGETVENPDINTTDNSILTEAIQALVALGYGNAEAVKAVRKIEVQEDTVVEEVLKQALKYML